MTKIDVGERAFRTTPGERTSRTSPGATTYNRSLKRSDTLDSFEPRRTPRSRPAIRREASFTGGLGKKSVSMSDVSVKSPRGSENKMGRKNRKGEVINVDFTPAEWNISNLSKYKR